MAGGLALLVAAGGGVLAVQHEPRPVRTPEEELALIKEFVATHRTASFEGVNGHTTDAIPPNGDPFEATSVEGFFEIPGGLASGTPELLAAGRPFVTVDEGTYSPYDRLWFFEPANTVRPRDGLSLGETWSALSIVSGHLGSFGRPFDLPAFLEQLHDLRLVRPGVVQTTVPMPQLVPRATVRAIEDALRRPGAPAGATPDDIVHDLLPFGGNDVMTVRLVSAADGRLDEVIVAPGPSVEGKSAWASSVRFSAWGDPVYIQVPPDSRLDHTLWVDEEQVASFTEFPLFGPHPPPAGMYLRELYITKRETSCTFATLGYLGHVVEWHTEPPSLSLLLERCGTKTPQGEPISFGRFHGTYICGSDSCTVWFSVDGLEIESRSSLPLEQLVDALSRLAPLDPAHLPTS